MKKIVLIFFSCWLMKDTVIGQADSLQADTLFKPTNYFVFLKPMKGEKIRAVLTLLRDDSVFLMPFYKKWVLGAGTFLIPKEKEVFAIAAENIKEIAINLDPAIVSEKWLSENKSSTIEKNVFVFILNSFVIGFALSQPGFSTEPSWGLLPWITAFIELLNTKTTTGTLVIPDNWTRWSIDGKKDKYRDLLLELAGLKRREDEDIFYKIEH